MPRLGPIKRDDLVRHLRKLGFEGPYAGGKHEFMIKGATTITIPNPHGRDLAASFSSEFSVRPVSTEVIGNVSDWTRALASGCARQRVGAKRHHGEDSGTYFKLKSIETRGPFPD